MCTKDTQLLLVAPFTHALQATEGREYGQNTKSVQETTTARERGSTTTTEEYRKSHLSQPLWDYVRFCPPSLCSHRINEFLCHRSGLPCLQSATYGWPSSQFHHFLRGFTLTRMRCNQLRCVPQHRT